MPARVVDAMDYRVWQRFPSGLALMLGLAGAALGPAGCRHAVTHGDTPGGAPARAGSLLEATAITPLRPASPEAPSTPQQPNRSERCGTPPALPPAGVPHLESYGDVQLSQRYWVDLERDGDDWTPATFVRMPLHHASRLELTNLSDYPVDDATTTLRVTFELTSRELVRYPRESNLRATYSARIENVCVLEPN